MKFLSEENEKLHRHYLEKLRLKYSILESSCEEIVNKNLFQIRAMKISKDIKSEVLKSLPEIILHNIYFSSFSDNKYSKSKTVEIQFQNECNFLNNLFSIGMKVKHGFIAIYQINSKIEIFSGSDYLKFFKFTYPSLTIDLCEHAYFYDYGFDKEKYLINALSFLNLKKID